MTPEEKEGNRIIAEGMGATVSVSYETQNCTYYSLKGGIVKEWKSKGLTCSGFGDRIMLESCKFHSDYKWIMEAVEFIESLGFQTVIFKAEDGQEFQVWKAGLSYDRQPGDLIIDSFFGNKTKKEAVFAGVVEFFKWYSKNK